MSPAIRTALPMAGISSCIKSEFRDSLSESMGVGGMSLFHYSGTYRTALAMYQRNKQTQLADSMMVNIEDIVMDAGLFGSLWELSVNDI